MSGVRIRREGRAGRITLARPEALNALSHAMTRAIAAALAAWAADPSVALVLIDAEGERAFCAGGDLQEIHAAGLRGDFGVARRFWADEYRLNARIAAYPKPIVALIHGFCMGGGVGLACHASHRVVGETAQVALPECGIGLVPDVGATTLLGRAPGRLGEYLGLTGHRMGPAQAIAAGFADGFVPQDRWDALAERLTREGTAAAVDDLACSAPGPVFSAQTDTGFDAADLAAVHAARPDEPGLARGSPLSMACTLALVRAAREVPGVPAALLREHRFTWRSVSEGELLEGIRAAVIDKDRRPRWRHTGSVVPPEEVEAMLAPLGEDALALD